MEPPPEEQTASESSVARELEEDYQEWKTKTIAQFRTRLRERLKVGPRKSSGQDALSRMTEEVRSKGAEAVGSCDGYLSWLYGKLSARPTRSSSIQQPTFAFGRAIFKRSDDPTKSHKYTLNFDVLAAQGDRLREMTDHEEPTAVVAEMKEGEEHAAVTVYIAKPTSEIPDVQEGGMSSQEQGDPEEGKLGEGSQDDQEDASSGLSSPPSDLRSPSPSSPGDVHMEDAPI